MSQCTVIHGGIKDLKVVYHRGFVVRDKTLKLFRGDQLHVELKGHTDAVWSVVFAANGKTIASSGFDRTIRLWCSETGELLRTFVGHETVVKALDISADGTKIVSGSDDSTVRMWDVSGPGTNTSVPMWIIESRSWNNSVVFNADGTRFLHCEQDGNVRLRSAQTGDVIKSYPKTTKSYGTPDCVSHAQFSQNEDMVAAYYWSGAIRVWDTDTCEILFEVSPKTSDGNKYTGIDGLIAISADRSKLTIWSIKSDETHEVDISGVLTTKERTLARTRVFAGELITRSWSSNSDWEWRWCLDEEEKRERLKTKKRKVEMQDELTAFMWHPDRVWDWCFDSGEKRWLGQNMLVVQ
jgi:hypothetical protein